MDKQSIAVAAVLGAVLGFGASFLLFYQQQQSLHYRLEQSPPIVLVDLAKLAASYPQGATPEQTNQLMLRTNDAIARLRDAGYLVIDAQAVLSAPSDLYLPPEEIVAGTVEGHEP